MIGLSVYRTKVAEAVSGPGVLRVGKGWDAGRPRQLLVDWHLDKLARLSGGTRLLGAYENVDQAEYISEKIFDAFAVGAMPLYHAGPTHRIAELVPDEARIDTAGLSIEDAAARIDDLTLETGHAAAWLDTCRGLFRLFGDLPAIRAERRRVADAAVRAVHTLLQSASR